MMTYNGLDESVLELLDFEFAPPCEAPKGCDSTAEWSLMLGCCGHVYLLCDECVNLLKDWKRRVQNVRFLNIKCRQCDNTIDVANFLFSIERI